MESYKLTFLDTVIQEQVISRQFIGKDYYDTLYTYQEEIIEADNVILGNGCWSFYVDGNLTYCVPVTMAIIEPVGEQIPNFTYVPVNSIDTEICTVSDSRVEYWVRIKQAEKKTETSKNVFNLAHRKEIIYATAIKHRDNMLLFYQGSDLIYAMSSAISVIDFQTPLTNFCIREVSAMSGPQGSVGATGDQGIQGPQGPAGVTGSTGSTGSTSAGPPLSGPVL